MCIHGCMKTQPKMRWIYNGQGKVQALSQVKETLKEPTSTWLFLLHYKQNRFPKGYTKKDSGVN